MKKISKKQMGKLIDLSRQYWVSARATGEPSESLLKERNKIASEIADKTGLSEFAIIDLVDSIVRCNGLLPDADNDEIYFVLRILGWRVKDEVQESESL